MVVIFDTKWPEIAKKIDGKLRTDKKNGQKFKKYGKILQTENYEKMAGDFSGKNFGKIFCKKQRKTAKKKRKKLKSDAAKFHRKFTLNLRLKHFQIFKKYGKIHKTIRKSCKIYKNYGKFKKFKS